MAKTAKDNSNAAGTDNGKRAMKIAAGIIAAGTAVAAGYYFYGSKNARTHRKTAGTWAKNMKAQVIEKSKHLEHITALDVARVVDSVVRTYKGVRSIDSRDLMRAADELKANWKMVKKEIEQAGKSGANRAASAGKKALSGSKKAVTRITKKAADAAADA